MKYKLVAIDMDGTLLTPNLEISKKTIDTARKVIDKGVIITLSTGRMYLAAIPFAETLQLDVPLITCNGALIKCAKTKKEYYKKAIKLSYVREIIDYCHDYNLPISIYKENDIFIEDYRNMYIHNHIDMAKPQVIKNNLDSILDESVIKILISSSEEFDLKYHTQKLYDIYKDNLTFYFSLPNFIEIVNLEVNKKNALVFLANHYNIKKEEIICIGDNFNDMEMIQYAGLGVAMGNSPDYLKEVADFVTRSNNEDGVNHVLEKFIIQKNTNLY